MGPPVPLAGCLADEVMRRLPGLARRRADDTSVDSDRYKNPWLALAGDLRGAGVKSGHGAAQNQAASGSCMTHARSRRPVSRAFHIAVGWLASLALEGQVSEGRIERCHWILRARLCTGR